MRPAGAPLIAFMYSRLPCWVADCFTFTLRDGSVYNWTSFDQPVTYGPTTYLAQGPMLQRSKLGVKNTVEVPELDLDLFALDTSFVGGINVKTALHNGYFDGATVEMNRFFMPTPGDTTLGPLLMFGGRMGQAKITAIGGSLTIRGANVLMNQYAPRNLYQPSCLHAFCDINCTLLETAFTLTGQTMLAGSSSTQLVWSSPPGDQAGYTLGKVSITSGVNTGAVRTAKFVDSGIIYLAYPLYGAPAPGDTFKILRGCDKTFDTGTGQDCTFYNNTQHWRGFDQVPPAEYAF